MLNYTLACIFTQQLIYTIIPHAVLVHIAKKEQTRDELRYRCRAHGYRSLSRATPSREIRTHFFRFYACIRPIRALRAFSPRRVQNGKPPLYRFKRMVSKARGRRVQFPGRFPSERLVQGFPTRESVLQTVLPGHQGGIGGNELLRMHSMTFLLIAPDSFVFLPVLPPGGGKPITRGNYLPRSSLSMISLASGACFSIFSGNPK